MSSFREFICGLFDKSKDQSKSIQNNDPDEYKHEIINDTNRELEPKSATEILENHKFVQDKYLGQNLHFPILFQKIFKQKLEGDEFLNKKLSRIFIENPTNEFKICNFNNKDEKHMHSCRCLDKYFNEFYNHLSLCVPKDRICVGMLYLSIRFNPDGSEIWKDGKGRILYCKITKGFFKDWYLCTYGSDIKIVQYLDDDKISMDSEPYFGCNNIKCICIGTSLTRCEVIINDS